jgi:hypothetical protein
MTTIARRRDDHLTIGSLSVPQRLRAVGLVIAATRANAREAE